MTNLKKYITKYYKKLFGASNNNSVSMDESYHDDIPEVSNWEKEMLIAPFSKDEVQEAIFYIIITQSLVQMVSHCFIKFFEFNER
jgi:hypothetical protein